MTGFTFPLRRKLAILLLALLALGGPGELAFAFKQPFHEQITEEVLRGQGFDEDSADEVGDSNYYTDVFESSNDAAHADNNQLGAASQRLRDKRTRIGDSLNACDRRPALDAFGEALHTVQDIYSHSNSIDNGHAIPNLLGLSNGTAACSLPNFAPGGLVTGYFSVGGFLTGNQCRGIPANMCCHRDLNKDEPGAANGARHGAALGAARGATTTYLQLVEQDVRARFGEPKATQLLKLFKRKQRTVFFVIDDTGSMGDDIAGVQSAVNSFLDQVVAGDEAPTLGLVSFKDDVNDRGPSCDIEALRSQVNALFADGGDDCPEASNSGLLAALSHFPLVVRDMQLRGGRILLATDASAGDASLGPQVAIQAALKGVSIDAILTGDCEAEEGLAALAAPLSAKGTSENGPAKGGRPATATAPPAVTATDPLSSISARTQLRALTEQTGGVLFNVERVEVEEVVPTLLELGEPDSAILVGRKVELAAGTPFVLEIPVDDTLRDKVTFMVTASRAGVLPTFTLRRPGGAVVQATDPDVSFRALSSVATYAVTAPVVGRWEVRLEGEGSFNVRAFGGTPLRVNSLRLQTATLDLLRPEVDLVPIEGQPVVGADLVADLRFSNAPQTAAAVLRRPDGSAIQDLSIATVDAGGRRRRGDLHVPAEPFVVEVTGLTPGGAEYDRQGSILVQPQTVAVEAAPRVVTAAPGTTAAFVATVRNAGAAAATFRLPIVSSLGWPVAAPATVTVGAGGSAAVDVAVTVPVGTPEGQINDLTITAEDVAAPQVRNSAIVSAVSGSGGTGGSPVCDGARPSTAAIWPPNHKMVAIEVLGVTDPDGDAVTVSIDTITQDEPVDAPGSGDTAPDGAGAGTATAQVRAERSGGGDGRVYAIGFTAEDGRGGRCSGKIEVGVPHDRRDEAVDSGQVYDSTAQP